MLHVTGIDLNPDSREEHLPGYTPNFPHIASLVQGARYFGGKASWHWHESVELFYVRKGAILYRTPHCEHVMRAGSGGMVNSNVLHSTQILKPEADLELVLHLFSPALVAGVPGVLRGQLSDSYRSYRHDGTHPVPAYVLSHCFGNFLGRPDFIAWCPDKRNWAVRLADALGAMPVMWTALPEHNTKQLEAENDAVIFQWYEPVEKYK